MSRNRRQVTRMIALEITPMIDVVFLLIIFFMTTAQFVAQTRAYLDLPLEAGEQEEEAAEAGLVINLTVDGDIIVASQTVTVDELSDLVNEETARQQSKGSEVTRLLIRADRRADSTQLNEVVSRLQTLGVGVARVATEVPR